MTIIGNRAIAIQIRTVPVKTALTIARKGYQLEN